jgi:Tol biopolymer transport system component
VGALARTGLNSHGSLDYAMDQIAATHKFTEVAISPDGKRVAWVEDRQEAAKSVSPVSAIYVLDLSSPYATARRVTGGEGSAARDEHDLAWSPDSSGVAFLSDREKSGQLQLYVAGAGGGPGAKVTTLRGALAMPRWSPDGKVVALLVYGKSSADARAVRTPASGYWGRRRAHL